MKNPQWIYRNLTSILAALLVLLLIFSTLSYSECYALMPSGKKIMLHTQEIKGYDCFTGKFTPPKTLPAEFEDLIGDKYGLFNFGLFSKMYIGLVGLVFLNIFFLLFRKRILAAIALSLGSLTASVCLIYFDGFHNYYAESVDLRFLISKTSDTDFGLLSSLIFWILFVVLLFFNWATAFTARKKILNNNLLDN